MPTNLLKKYPELLEILHLNEYERIKSLRAIFDRDIQNNPDFKFRIKQIFPIKTDGEIDMSRQFKHLTCEEIFEEDETGRMIPKRVFEKDRSQRLHWIKVHVNETYPPKIEVFSIIERDEKKRKDVTRTYIYDKKEKYIIVLEPLRECTAYFLLTAYYLNKPYAEKQMKKKLKKKLVEVL